MERSTKGGCHAPSPPQLSQTQADGPNSVDKRTGEAVAIKVIDVENADDEVEDIIQEIAILSELQSPYVTKYYGSYAKNAELWIVMEFCSGGSCLDLLKPKPGVFAEDYVAIIMRELLLGLDYLHADKKLHRDVKGRCRPGSRRGRRLTLGKLPMFCSTPTGRSSWPTLACPASSRPP